MAKNALNVEHGVATSNVTSLYVYFNVGIYGFYYKFLATLNQFNKDIVFFLLLCDIDIKLIKYFYGLHTIQTM